MKRFDPKKEEYLSVMTHLLVDLRDEMVKFILGGHEG
jgi:hypothetical protein